MQLRSPPYPGLGLLFFLFFQDNMGFLLQAPECPVTESSEEIAGNEDEAGIGPSSPPARVLRIPCTHRAYVETISRPFDCHFGSFGSLFYEREILLEDLLKLFAS